MAFNEFDDRQNDAWQEFLGSVDSRLVERMQSGQPDALIVYVILRVVHNIQMFDDEVALQEGAVGLEIASQLKTLQNAATSLATPLETIATMRDDLKNLNGRQSAMKQGHEITNKARTVNAEHLLNMITKYVKGVSPMEGLEYTDGSVRLLEQAEVESVETGTVFPLGIAVQQILSGIMRQPLEEIYPRALPAEKPAKPKLQMEAPSAKHLFSDWADALNINNVSEDYIAPYREAIQKVVETNPELFTVGQKIDDTELYLLEFVPDLVTVDIARQAFQDSQSLAHLLAISYRTATFVQEPVDPDRFIELAQQILDGAYDTSLTISYALAQHLMEVKQEVHIEQTLSEQHIVAPHHFPKNDDETKQFILYAAGLIRSEAQMKKTPYPLPISLKNLIINDHQITHLMRKSYNKHWVAKVLDRYDLGYLEKGQGTMIHTFGFGDFLRLIALNIYERRGDNIDKKILLNGIDHVLNGLTI